MGFRQLWIRLLWVRPPSGTPKRLPIWESIFISAIVPLGDDVGSSSSSTLSSDIGGIVLERCESFASTNQPIRLGSFSAISFVPNSVNRRASRFPYLIQHNHRVGFGAQLAGQLAFFLVTNIAWQRARSSEMLWHITAREFSALLIRSRSL